MAKEETKRASQLTVADGMRFGLGFFMVNAIGVIAIVVAAWLILLVARYLGLAF